MLNRTIRCGSVLAVALALSPLPAAAAAPPDAPIPNPVVMSQARAEVNKLLAAQSVEWNRGDLEAFVAGYADDATFVTPSGLTVGRQAVLARYRKRYPDGKAMGTLTLTVVEARPLGVDVASGTITSLSVVARWQLAHPEDAAAKKAEGLTLLVFQRRGGRWQILEDASM
jgi:uncharacterized protein (TIGR02246 family)